MRTGGKRAVLTASQANSAVSRGALAGDPRLEMTAKEKIHGKGDAPTAPQLQQAARRKKDKGGVKFALALSASGKKGKKAAAAFLQARMKAVAPDSVLEESENSAVDRKALLNDPRLERDSFARRTRSLDDGESSVHSRRRSLDDGEASLPSSISASHRSDSAARRNTLGRSEYSFREDFISAMLVEHAVDKLNVTQSVPPSLGKHDKIVGSISEMGFERAKVEDTIEDLNRSGSKVNVDNVLGALLGSSSRNVGSPEARSSPGLDQNDVQKNRSTGKNREAARTAKPSKKESAEEELICMEITPGHYAHLLKGQQTYKAVHNGTALSTKCVLCDMTLKCTPEANYVLCPDCNVVSPLTTSKGRNVRRNMIDGCKRRPGLGRHVGYVGLGYTKSKK